MASSNSRRWGKSQKQAPSGIYPHRSNCQMRLANLVTCTQIMDIEYSSDRKRQKITPNLQVGGRAGE